MNAIRTTTRIKANGLEDQRMHESLNFVGFSVNCAKTT